jgi:polyhydroxyalkanoate synthase
MFQNFFSDYLVKLQESNQQWWKDFEQGKAAVNSPLTKAMQELNAEDNAEYIEK